MPESARTDRWKTSRILASILFAAVVSFSACTPTYSLMEGDELFAFWDMSHPLYHGRTLHVLMPEGYYHFVENVSVEYRGVECFVTGKATRDGSGERNVVRLPMLESRQELGLEDEE
ncbi:MAG: hypothetical protein C0600_10045 [Ignavibacteria bacterium]|nr:MAG: hypothetical protein C0600_10045 [Ignavibacteria bacterium]